MASPLALAAVLDERDRQPAMFGVGQRPSFATMYPGVGMDTPPLPSASTPWYGEQPGIVAKMLMGARDTLMQANQAMPWGGNDPSAVGIDPQAGTMDPSVMVPFASNVAGMATTGALGAPPVAGAAGMGIRSALPDGLPMDYASRMARAKEMGFANDVYHGTHADISEFDPSMVDIGVHLGGSPQQANNRLKDTQYGVLGGRRLSATYRDNANVMPLKANLGKSLEMDDVGMWNDSAAVARALQKKGFRVSDILDEADEVKSQFEDMADWLDSPENRRNLDDLNAAIREAGYDSVKYKNQVENDYNDLTPLKPDVRARQQAFWDSAQKIEQRARDRMPQLPEGVPTDADIQRWLNAKVEDYLTPDEAAEIKRLNDAGTALSKDESNYIDPYSYIALDPAKIRSIAAAFDPAQASSPNILAANGTPIYLGGSDPASASQPAYATGGRF